MKASPSARYVLTAAHLIPESEAGLMETPEVTQTFIDAVLAQAQQLRAQEPQAPPIRRTILESRPGGIVSVLEGYDEEEGKAMQFLELLRVRGKTQAIPLYPATMDALCAWWQVRKEGA